MKRSVREILAESHIAAVAIAVLLLWALTSGASAVSIPFYEAAEWRGFCRAGFTVWGLCAR